MPFEQSIAASQEQQRLIRGKRIRHFRTRSGFTLEQLSERVGIGPSALSLIENGRREPKLSLLETMANVFNIPLTELLAQEAPDLRSSLEIELERAQALSKQVNPNIPHIKNVRGVSDDALESLVGLHRELQRLTRAAASTPEAARKANTIIRLEMRKENNYLPDIESAAEDLMAKVGHTSGAVTHRTVAVLAESLGFTLIFVDDLPSNTRSITDLDNGRIYLPPASIPGGHGLRALALQAMAHRVLGHNPPASYEEFLRQRLQINYFASACLMPEKAASAFLKDAKKQRNLAIEDLRDAFGVTHEAAAHRFTNLATKHLDLDVHFYRADSGGSLLRGYENNAFPYPSDQSGSIEGQILCRFWAGRTAFQRKNRTSEFYQYTDTPEGTYWETSQIGDQGQGGAFSITCGVPFDDAKWFRGRDTVARAKSTCPDPLCCRTPSEELTALWAGAAWPSARMHQHILSPLPTGEFPGVSDTEMYEFLSSHASALDAPA